MKIAVKSFWKAQSSIDNAEFDYAISLVASEGEERCPQRGPNHLIVQFDDAETDRVFYENQWWVGPSEEDVETILTWAKDIPPDASLLVHCTAGKSRSTAVAVAVLIQAGLTPKEALTEVIVAREREGSDIVIPNRRITRFADDQLGLNGALNEAIDTHYANIDRLGRVPLALLKRGRHTPED